MVKKMLIALLTITILTACTEVTNNDYIFIGSSEHWEAEYVYKGTEKWGKSEGKSTYTNEDSYEFTLKYNGSLEELSHIETLEYSYDTISSGGHVVEEFTEPLDQTIFTSKGGSKSGAKVSEDEVIKVTVKWDGNKESFELDNKK